MAYLGRKGASAALTSAYKPNDSITSAKIPDDALDSEHYTDGSIDSAHIGDDQVTGDKLANDIAISTTADIASTTGRVLIGDSPASYAATTADDLTIRPPSGANGGITLIVG